MEMDKLVVISGGLDNQEFTLEGQQTSLGRDQANDVCLSDKSVSRHHADVVRVASRYFLHDAKSTNGTRLNGLDIKKHILNHGDEIDIGKYKLRFQETNGADESEDLDKTVVLRPQVVNSRPSASSAPAASQPSRPAAAESRKQARVHFLSGPDEGELHEINKSFFTIGKPGGNLILINRRHTGYFLLKMGGDAPPSVNGETVKAGGVELQDGDRVRLGELDFKFLLA